MCQFARTSTSSWLARPGRANPFTCRQGLGSPVTLPHGLFAVQNCCMLRPEALASEGCARDHHADLHQLLSWGLFGRCFTRRHLRYLPLFRRVRRGGPGSDACQPAAGPRTRAQSFRILLEPASTAQDLLDSKFEKRRRGVYGEMLGVFSLGVCLSLFSFTTLGVGLLDFKLNSPPRPELFSSPGLLLAHPWSAQPRSVPGVPNSRVSMESPQGAQPQSLPQSPESHLPRVPPPRLPPACPAPESPWSAQPHSLPRVPNPRLSPECPAPECCCWSAQPQSISTKERVGMFEGKYFCLFLLDAG